MNTDNICLPRKLTNQLLHLAQLSPDLEICGLVAATANGIPCSCYPIANNADTPERRFNMDAAQQISAMKQIRDKGETLFAIYHSHPSSPAVPSIHDIQQAAYPEAVHLIISLDTKGVLEMRAFQLTENHFKEIGLTLIDA